MRRSNLSLDSCLRRKPVYLDNSLREFGFVDDVIIDPKSGVLAIVSHDGRSGTWAFPYTNTLIGSGRITVSESSKQSPGVFLRQGRSYQEMLGGKVLGPDGAIMGRIKDIELVDLHTGDVAYRVSRPGLAGLWKSTFLVRASTDVVAERYSGIVLRSAVQPERSTIPLKRAA